MSVHRMLPELSSSAINPARKAMPAWASSHSAGFIDIPAASSLTPRADARPPLPSSAFSAMPTAWAVTPWGCSCWARDWLSLREPLRV